MVTVRDLGAGAEGKTPLGGPIILHSSQGINYLPNIVAHELVHVFQSQYYSRYFVGYAATWFIEGTADFYSELVFNPYNKSVDVHYLSVPIDASDDNSYYNVKYFLKWLSETYGNNIVGDALSQRRSKEGSLLDENNLSVAINELNTSDDINTAFEKYCWYVMQNPDKTVNSEIKAKMETYISKSSSGNPSYEHVSNPSTTFEDKKTFFTLSDYMEPLSAVYFVMRSKSSEDARLVIAPADVSGKGIIGTMSYVGVGKTSADYQGKHTVEQDNGLSADVPRLNMLTVKNFKKGTAVEHMLYHPDRLAQGLILIMDYYILQVPKVTWVQPASTGSGTRITWQAVGNIGRRGGIPADYIKGYDIFDASGSKLNAGKIPVTVGVASQYYEISALDPSGKTIKDFTVVIEDKYGNTWPEITPSNNSSDKFKKLYVRIGAEFSSTGPNENCKTQTLVPYPMTFESLIWLGNNNFTGTMLYEGTTGKWPVGTVTGQISNDKPPKLNLDISLSFPETKIKLIDIPNIGVENEYNCSDDAAKHSLVSFYELLFGCEFTQDTVKTVNLIQATFQDPY